MASTAAGADDLTLARARAGDPDAFATLIERHDRSLRALAFRLLGDANAMDDVLQEAYLKAFRALPRFRGQSTVATWLYRVVYNACLDELRRGRGKERVALDPAAIGGNARDPAEAAGARSELATALALLAPEQRAAVLLVDAEGLDYQAAAEVLGIKVGTVASRLSRARAVLRRALSTEGAGT